MNEEAEYRVAGVTTKLFHVLECMLHDRRFSYAGFSFDPDEASREFDPFLICRILKELSACVHSWDNLL